MTIDQADLRQRTGAGGYFSAWPARLLLHSLLAIAVLIGSTLPTFAQTQAPAQAKPELERIQDWTLQCTQAEADKLKTCFLIHDVFRTEGGERILQIVVGRFGGNNVLAALFFVPLGIRLPPGLTLQVDQNAAQQMPLERCTTQGCQAQVLLDDDMLATFKAGLGGELSFDDAAGRTIAVAFSLKGFTAGVGKLP